MCGETECCWSVHPGPLSCQPLFSDWCLAAGSSLRGENWEEERRTPHTGAGAALPAGWMGKVLQVSAEFLRSAMHGKDPVLLLHGGAEPLLQRGRASVRVQPDYQHHPGEVPRLSLPNSQTHTEGRRALLLSAELGGTASAFFAVPPDTKRLWFRPNRCFLST